MTAPPFIRKASARIAVISLLAASVTLTSAVFDVSPAAAAPCPAGTTTTPVTWGAAGGVVWDDATQNTGLSKTYANVGGSTVDMTMSIDDPSNMNEDADNPIVNLGIGNWDGPLYTQTDGAYGNGYLTAVMTSLDDAQAVTFTLDFSAPVVVGEFSIGDIDYTGNNAPSNAAPHDSFQDEILLSAQRNGTPVGFTGSTGTPGSPVITLNDATNGLFRVAGGPYDNDTNGNLAPGDAAGTVYLETNAPVTSLSFAYSNGPDDVVGDQASLTAVGGTWPNANWAAPMTETSVGVSNNHAVRINVFTVCVGALSIGDRVWADVDGDGVQDAGEPGIPGVTVTLIGQDGNAIGDSVTTDGNGDYVFDQLPPWDYSVEISNTPAGYTHTYDRDDGTTSPDGDSGTIGLTTTDVTDADFGLQPPTGSVSGTVFVDQDDDGLLDAGDGDTGLGGVTLALVGTDLGGNAVNRTTMTDANGDYSFSGVRAGNYTVTESQPASYDDGVDTPGTNASAGGNDTHSITLGVGQSSIDNDFAEIATASIAGSVFEDDDNDGTPDVGEGGIENVTVALTGTDDGGNAVSRTTTTDGNGEYVFDRLRPGTYTVTETQPGGYIDGIDDAGSAGGDDASTNDVISAISLPIGVDATDYDFGEVSSSSISGSVVDDGGVGIANVAVELSGTDDLGDPVTASTTTDGSGDYSFTGLRPGTYTVTETQPAGYGDGAESAGSTGGDDSSVNDVISGIVLGSGVDSVDNDFAETTGSIAGSVFDDSGVGIANVAVELSGTDALGDPVTASTTTDANGDYLFDDLLAGTYTVTETQPAGYGDGAESAGSTGGDDSSVNDVISGIVLGSGVDSVDNDFAETTGSIAGSVFEDLDNDGTLDAGEAGIENVTVELSGTDALGNPVTASTTTDANGDYLFDDLLGGTYTVTETQPGGYTDGKDDVGSSGGDAGVNDVISAIALAGGADATDYDFGEVLRSSIGGTVFVDLNNDGVQDAGETGIENVTVDLTGTDDLGNPVSMSTTTGADGAYAFGGLRPGTYTVTETQPASYLDGIDTVGSEGGDGSVDDEVSAILLSAFTAATDYDFGEVPPSSVGGSVVDDLGRAIPNTTVVLTGTDDRGDPVSSSTTTGPDGSYAFEGLRPGSYTVAETQPTGFGDGGEAAGSSGGDDSADDVISGIVLAPGADSVDNDFDETTASVGGTIFHDRDEDGAMDPGEPLLEGVTVTLTGTDDLGNPVEITTTTDENGDYSFDGLLGGTYTITESQPERFRDGSDQPGSAGGDDSVNDIVSSIALAPGVDADDYDFAELGVDITGTVWVDADEDGVRDPEESDRLGGVVLTLIDPEGNTIATTTTDDGGNYEFSSVPSGDYVIVQDQPDSFDTTTPNEIAVSVPLTGLSEVDFGEDATPTATPTTTTVPSVTPTPSTPLPASGSNSGLLVSWALSFVLVGAVLVLIGRRRSGGIGIG